MLVNALIFHSGVGRILVQGGAGAIGMILDGTQNGIFEKPPYLLLHHIRIHFSTPHKSKAYPTRSYFCVSLIARPAPLGSYFLSKIQ